MAIDTNKRQSQQFPSTPVPKQKSIPQSAPGQSTVSPSGTSGYTTPLPPPKKKGGGGGSNIPQSTPAGTPPLPPPDGAVNLPSPDSLTAVQSPLGTKSTAQIQQARLNIQIQTQPYLRQDVVGQITNPLTKQVTPVFGALQYRDPTVLGQETVRPATQEESAYYKEQLKKQEDVNRIRAVPYSPTKRFIGEASGVVKQEVNQLLINKEEYNKQISSLLGTDQALKEVSMTAAKIINPLGTNKGGQEFLGNVLYGGASYIKNKPIDVIGTLGIGAAVGAVIKAPVLSQSVTAFLNQNKLAVRYAGYGLGGVFVGSQVATSIPKIISLPTKEDRYQYVGEEITKNLVFIKGYQAGTSIYKKEFFVSSKGFKTNIAVDEIQPIVSKGGTQIEVGKFNLKSIQPAKIVYSDMPIKRFLRDTLNIRRPFTSLSYEATLPKITRGTAGLVITKEGEIVLGGTTSKRYGAIKGYQFSSLQGKQKVLDIKEFNQLNKINQRTLKEITQGIYKEKNIYSVGQLQSTKLNKFKVGKRTTKFATVTEAELMLEQEGQFSIYKTKTGLKDITKVNARASGDIAKIGGVTKVYEPKIVNDIDVYGMRFNKPKTDIPKDLFARLEQSLTQEPKANTENIKKALFNLQNAKGSTIKEIKALNADLTSKRLSTIKAKETPALRLPLIVGGAGQERSIYYGKGRSIVYTAQEPLSLNINNQVNKEITKTFTTSINKEIQKPVNRTISKTIEKEVLKEVQKPIEKTIEKGLQKQIQKPIQKPLQKQPTFITPFPKTPREPIKLPPSMEFRYKPSKLTSGVFGYRTFVKRFGKYRALPGVREKGAALTLGERVALKSTIASFKVAPTKVKVQAKESKYTPSSLFRGYKIRGRERISLQDEFIQRKGKRLSFRSEVKDLLSFKNKKRRRK